jgi:hypothetical protein
MEIDGDTLHFQVINGSGVTVDGGSFRRPDAPDPASSLDGESTGR